MADDIQVDPFFSHNVSHTKNLKQVNNNVALDKQQWKNQKWLFHNSEKVKKRT